MSAITPSRTCLRSATRPRTISTGICISSATAPISAIFQSRLRCIRIPPVTGGLPKPAGALTGSSRVPILLSGPRAPAAAVREAQKAAEMRREVPAARRIPRRGRFRRSSCRAAPAAGRPASARLTVRPIEAARTICVASSAANGADLIMAIPFFLGCCHLRRGKGAPRDAH